MVENSQATTGPMTIGTLSRRTGVAVKTLRAYEDLGLIYSLGRSEGNYRLFGEEALWCVGVVAMLRDLGLTLVEIAELTDAYLHDTERPDGPQLAAVLGAVRARTKAHVAVLTERLDRIAAFEETFADELAGLADFKALDPTFRTRTA